MNRDQDNFYEFVYKTFYSFSEVKPEDVGLTFSKDVKHPLLESIDNPSIVVPLPKLVNEKYEYEGMIFENTPEGRKDIWSLFLATIYHLSAHAASSLYPKYDKWRKNKTMDICWQVIDFIEDISADRYLYHKNKEIWNNIKVIESRILDSNNQICSGQKEIKNNFHAASDHTRIDSVRNLIIKNIGKEGYEKKLLYTADYLYKNRELLSNTILPFHEHHDTSWSPKIEKKNVAFEPFGEFEEQTTRLDELWEINEQMRRRVFRRYKKHLKGLNFDKIVIPQGNFPAYEKIQVRALPMLRRIRQQIRLIANLTDEPKIDEIGYIDMQMAIQAIASEGQSNAVFERDELRRGEEAWVILVDKSASMELRFDRLQEFTICVSESANELTGKADAWALFSFDNNFNILKDFKERYNMEVKSRIGTMNNGGLSLLPDAIELSSRVLAEDPRERKFLFVITDGHPSGYDRIQEAFSRVVKKTEISGITLVGIGVTKAITRKFRNNARGTDLKELVIKFITAYRTASSQDL
ncbi:MAG: VWA domain-containing protein [Thaumarchaeota archaeon]|nr:VWA domain-containing protein [Nitrososphaerota archaeon]